MSFAKLVVVSGPSGVGKTTVCNLLLQRPEFERVVTATTRAPRGQEQHGVDYLFLARDEFEKWIADGRFLEWATVHGQLYGSPRAQAETILDKGVHALLNIAVQGAASVKETDLPAIRIFLLPPSWKELERRLRGRGTDPADVIERRLLDAREELARMDEFDRCVINESSEDAAAEIAALVAGDDANPPTATDT